MNTTTKPSVWFHLMAAVTVAIWGTTFVSTKVLIGYGLSATDILFYRFIMAYICIWFFSPVFCGLNHGGTKVFLYSSDLRVVHFISLPRIQLLA